MVFYEVAILLKKIPFLYKQFMIKWEHTCMKRCKYESILRTGKLDERLHFYLSNVGDELGLRKQ